MNGSRMAGQKLVNRRRVTFLIACCAIAALMWIAADGMLSATDRPEDVRRIAVGATAPEFHAIDMDGQPLQLSDFRGRTVLLNFWASWCTSCVKEMPLIEDIHQTLSAEVQVLSVNVGESKGTAFEYLSRYDYTFPVIMDATGRISDLYRVTGLPATFVVDPSGNLRAAEAGELSNREHVQTLLGL